MVVCLRGSNRHGAPKRRAPLLDSCLLVLAWLPLTPTLAAAQCLGDTSAPRELKVQVVPQNTAEVLYERWAPFLERLGERTGNCFNLRVVGSIPEFERHLYRGEPDMASANPYVAVKARKKVGYWFLATDSSRTLSGVLVVRADSGVDSIKALNGRTIAFPAPNAFAASLLLRAELDARGVQFTPVYMGNHDNVYRSVALGRADAGGGINLSLQQETPEVRQRLRVLYETRGYPPHPLIVHPRVQREDRERILAELIKMADDPLDQRLIQGVQLARPVRVDYERQYAPLERMGLERFYAINGE